MRLRDLLGDRKYFYIMHLSYGAGTDEDKEKHWEFGKSSNLIGLDRTDINQDWNDLGEDEKETFRSSNPNWYRQFETFCNKMTKDDIVVVMAGLDSILGIGLITRHDYFYCPKFKTDRTFFDHVRNISWITAWDYKSNNRPFLSEPLMIFNDTLRRVAPNSSFWNAIIDLSWKDSLG